MRKKKSKPRKRPKNPITTNETLDQIAHIRHIAQEGKGGYIFVHPSQKPIEAHIFIGPNTEFDKLVELTFPILLTDYINTFGYQSDKPPIIDIYDNELDHDPRRIWEVSSTRHRYVGAALALCYTLQSASALQFLAPSCQALLCSCLFGRHISIVVEWINYQEFYDALCHFHIYGDEPESLSFIPPQ